MPVARACRGGAGAGHGGVRLCSVRPSLRFTHSAVSAFSFVRVSAHLPASKPAWMRRGAAFRTAASAKSNAEEATSSTSEVEASEPSPSEQAAASIISELSAPTLVVEDTIEHAGGTLTILKIANATLDTWPDNAQRRLRVWKPPNFDAKKPPMKDGWPCVFLNDGQNLFDDDMSFAPQSWRAGLATAEAIRAGKIPPCVLVGIDHAGERRSFDYLCFPPGTGDGDFRAEAKDWPGGGAEPYCDWVVNELMPLLRTRYGISTAPNHLTFGGSSFGGMVAITMSMRYPDVFGSMIIFSASFWAGEGRYLRDCAGYEGNLPKRMFVGFGKREFTGTRDSNEYNIDFRLVAYIDQYVQVVKDLGLGPDRLYYALEEDMCHTEADWAKMYPRALGFALETVITKSADGEVVVSPAASNLDRGELERLGREMSNQLFFTLPAEMVPGHPTTVYFNANCSELLRGKRNPKLHGGYNGWTMDKFSVAMGPCDIPTFDYAEWWSATFTVPKSATQLNAVFSDDVEEEWDNNNGEDYLMTIANPEIEKPISDEVINAFDEEARKLWEKRAKPEHWDDMIFTLPNPIVAGEPCAIYMNPKRSSVLMNVEPITCFGGFNGWTNGNFEIVLRSAPLQQYDVVRWMTNKINVPKDAYDLHLSFADEHKLMHDNNNTDDYILKVQNPEQKRVARTISEIEEQDHAGGKLEIVRLASRPGSTKKAKWKEERMLRVWTPPGYQKDNAPEGGYPVLVMNDGKNLYEDWLAHQGVSWNIGYCAADLIGNGILPPFIVVGIDSPGPFRSQCYLPFPPGCGAHDHRPDAARWPGGDVESYMERIVGEVLPLIQSHWGGSMQREKLALGGASFGGVCSLYTAMKYPDTFSAILAESPSLWSGEGRFLEDMQKHKGEWAEKIFIGSGTREYSGTRDHEWQEIDDLLLHYNQEAVRILEEKGVHQDEGRLAFQIEEGAGHIESAWGHRLRGSLQFLLSHWNDNNHQSNGEQ